MHPSAVSRHLADSAKVYEDYKFYRGSPYLENKVDEFTTVFKACALADIQSRYIIKVQRFQQSRIQRFLALTKAVEEKLVLASKIFLEKGDVEGWMVAHVVEPSPESSACETLGNILKTGNLTYGQRQTIFRNLVDAVLELHRLGVPHLELSPSSVLLETKSVVYLRPFSVGPKTQSDYYWYNSPEELFTDSMQELTCDVWALGCIYAEMFVSLTPLFQSISPVQKLTKMFEVLGLPEFREVEGYVSWELYEEARNAITPESATGELLRTLNDQERKVLLSMLQFHPAARKRLEEIQGTCAPMIRAVYSEARDARSRYGDQVATGPYEYYEASRSAYSSIKSSQVRESIGKRPAHMSNIDQIDYQTPEEEPFGSQTVSSLLSDPSPKASSIPLQVRPEKRDSLNLRIRSKMPSHASAQTGHSDTPEFQDIDNTLTVSILSVKNLQLFKYVQELEGTIDYHLSFSYELDSSGTTETVQTPAYKAGERMTIGHIQEFHINSEHFKKMHRHQPIVVSVLQGGTAQSADEQLLGVAEVYLGLLFSSLGDSGCVRGWYHILPSNSQLPLGQLEVEVKTRLPITRTSSLLFSESLSWKESPERTAVSGSERTKDVLSTVCAGKRYP